jgi:hypothetical protein
MTISAHENAILAHEMMIERRVDMRGHKDDDANWTACLKSVMHEHPNSIALFLADGRIKFTLPDGKSEERDVKAGQPCGTSQASTCPKT